jgi:uncharacterized protein YjbI with pentapeptide repeats
VVGNSSLFLSFAASCYRLGTNSVRLDPHSPSMVNKLPFIIHSSQLSPTMRVFPPTSVTEVQTMANLEHLKILKQGVSTWNKWREENPEGKIDLSNASLVGANLSRSDFGKVNLGGVNLKEADLGETLLDNANFENADLRAARLCSAFLRDANLTAANLYYADLRAADLSAARLDHADFTLVCTNGTRFGDNDLSTVKGLDTVEHLGPSTIGIDTIYKSKGNIPEVFLRGAGVPEDFIVYMKSLVGKAIDFYSCFISYSSQDDDFAQRLHADLQQKGVRCWFAPEDLKIGDKFRTRIDESIRVYDKVIVVLSENSIPSGWVEKEVETAFEREQREKKLVLFPIRLDDAVMETNQAWAADIRRVRHIGDFHTWKDHDQYQKSFERLLRDLKTG